MDKVLYRNNNTFGDNVRKSLDVIVYEIFELGNADILEYCTEHYALSSELRNKIDDIIDNIGDVDEDTVITIVKSLLNELKMIFNRPIKEVIWLASLEAVNDLYAGTDDNADIEAYSVEDAIVLSNLGYDGLLFGFFERPNMLNEKLCRMMYKNRGFRCIKDGKLLYKKTNFSYEPKFQRNRLNENFIINQVVPMLERYGLIEYNNLKYDEICSEISNKLENFVNNITTLSNNTQIAYVSGLEDNYYVFDFDMSICCNWIDKLYVLYDYSSNEHYFSIFDINNQTYNLYIDDNVVKATEVKNNKLKTGTILLGGKLKNIKPIIKHELKHLYDYLINQTKKSADFNVDVLNRDIYINNLNGNDLLSISQFIHLSDNDKHNIDKIHMFLIEAVYYMNYSEMQARLENYKTEIEIDKNLTQQYYIYLRYKEQFKWLIDNLSSTEIKQYNEKYIDIFKKIYPQFSKSKKQISIIDILKQYIKRIDNLFFKQADKIKRDH